MYQGKFQKDKKSGNFAKTGHSAAETVRTPKARTYSKKRRRTTAGTIVFYCLLCSFILIFCIGMSVAMNALNDWLVRFEASQPTAKCEAVFAELFASPDWESIYELAETQGDITAGNYAKYMTEKVGDTALTYIETSAGLSGDKKYIVRCGSEKVATFTLRNTAPNADIPDWQLGTLEIFYQAGMSATVMAPPEYTVLVDGTQLDDSYVVRRVTTKAEDYLPNDVHGYRMNELVVHDLLTEPTIHVLDPEGTPLEVHYDSQTRCYSVELGTPEVTEEHRQTLIDASETYCKYMIGDASQTALRNYFDNRSDIYRTITENTTWMQSYARYELGEAQITDYYCYNSEYFSARVALTVNVTRKDGSIKQYALDNTFFVKKAGEQWMVWDMINSNPQDTVTEVRLSYVSQDQLIHTEMVDAQSSSLTLPEVTVPEGKTFTGWFTQSVNDNGSTTMELVFEPSEDGTVQLPYDTVLEPMTLFALYQ